MPTPIRWPVPRELSPKEVRVAAKLRRMGQVTTYSYAVDNALAQKAYTNAVNATSPVSYTYDAAYAVPMSMTDGVGTTTYGYKPVGVLGALRLASVDGPFTDDAITYGYDELGRRTSHALNGSATSRTFDALGRVATLVHAIGTFAYTYVGHTARVQTLTAPNGQSSNYAYFGSTNDRRLQTIHHTAPGGATLSKFDYTYDVVGNISSWRQERASQSAFQYLFTYDAADQIVAAVKQSTAPTPTVLTRQAWAYDPAGNRTIDQQDDAVLAAAHDPLNRLTARAPGGALTFAGTVSEPATVTIGGRLANVDSANRFRGIAVAASTSQVSCTTVWVALRRASLLRLSATEWNPDPQRPSVATPQRRQEVARNPATSMITRGYR